MSTQGPPGGVIPPRRNRRPDSAQPDKAKEEPFDEGRPQLSLSPRARVMADVDQLMRNREALEELLLLLNELMATPGRLVMKEAYDGVVVEAVHDRAVVIYAVGEDRVEQTYDLSQFIDEGLPAEGTRLRVQVEVYELPADEVEEFGDEKVELTDESIARGPEKLTEPTEF